MLITIKLICLDIKKDLLILSYNFKYKIMNDKLKETIEYAMFKHKVSKLELSEYMDISYPTMLLKLKRPELMKFSEADKLCKILNLELRVDFLNI